MIGQRPQSDAQYSLLQIVSIWAAAAIPMAILGWVVAPALAPLVDKPLYISGIARVLSLTLGLIWQFAFSMVVVYREAGDLRLSTIARRLRLNAPRDPRTGQPRGRLWLWLIPLSLAVPALSFSITPVVDRLWVSVFPFLSALEGYSFDEFLSSPENRAQLVGAWWFLGLFVLLALFNTFLGEEFLFRGVMLPRMKRVFRRWDWVANGVLFGAYHLHQPWSIPGSVLVSALLFAFPASYFGSTWMSIIIHSGQSVFFGVFIFGAVLG